MGHLLPLHSPDPRGPSHISSRCKVPALSTWDSFDFQRGGHCPGSPGNGHSLRLPELHEGLGSALRDSGVSVWGQELEFDDVCGLLPARDIL